jgi:hypothetical protein
MVTNSEHRVRIPYYHDHEHVKEHVDDLSNQANDPHTLPEHGSEIVKEGKWQFSKEPEVAKPSKKAGVVYVRRRVGDEGETVQPERLVTLREVVDTLNVPPSTVQHWVATGRLQERGRIWLGKPGGRSTPLVSESEAESLKNTPPPMGRPRKRRK